MGGVRNDFVGLQGGGEGRGREREVKMGGVGE